MEFRGLLALLVTWFDVQRCVVDAWNDVSYSYQEPFQYRIGEARDHSWIFHFIEHRKTYSEAEEYCHDLCEECGLLDPLWLRNHTEEFRPYVNGRVSWVGPRGYDQQQIGLCPVLKELDESPWLEPCASQMSFFCVLPKGAWQCQSSLIVRKPADYRHMSLGCGRWGGSSTAPLNFLESQERPCAKLHAGLSSAWWTSSGPHHTRWLHAYLGPPRDYCMSAKPSVTGGFSVARVDCDLVLPYICLQSMSEDNHSTDHVTAPSPEPVRRPERVSCYYFTGEAVGTYCHILDPDGAVNAAEAKEQCDMLDMDLVSARLVDPHRLCLLIDIFGIVDDRLWIANLPEDISSSLRSDECDLVLGNVTIGKNGSSICSNCSARVVCAGPFYQRSADRVTISGDTRVDYRYFDVAKNAFESEGQCMRDSLSLLNVKTVFEPWVRRALYPVVEYHRSEVWLDLSDTEVSSMSAVVGFLPNAEERKNKTKRCFSAWFGREVPWIFERECDKKLTVICVGTHPATPPGTHNDNCRYHRVENSNIVYCSPSTEVYAPREGSVYCHGRNMSLLNAKTLNHLRYFSVGKDASTNSSEIWVKDEKETSSSLCTVVEQLIKRTKDYCKSVHPYVCRGQLTDVQQTTCLECKYCTRPYTFCIGNVFGYSNYILASVTCRTHNRFLLPGNLDYNDYLQLFLSLATGASEVIEVWLHSPSRSENGNSCLSMYYRDNQVFSREVNCSAKLRIICVDSLYLGNTQVSSAVTLPRKDEFVTDSTGVTYQCPEEEEQDYRWPTTRQNEYAAVPCNSLAVHQDGPMARRKCTSLGEWEYFIDTSACVSKIVVEMLDRAKELNDTHKIGQVLTNISKEISMGGDLLALAEGVFEALDRLDDLIANLPRDMKSTRVESLAKQAVAVARNVMEKESAWRELPHENRLEAATQYMSSIEECAKKVVRYSAENATVDLSQGDVIVEVRKSSKEALGKELSLPAKDTGTSVSLPSNFIQSDGNVSIVYAEYPSLGALLNTKQREVSNEGGSYDVATPVVTATVLLGQTPQSRISANVTLRFKNMGKTRCNAEQKCVFLLNDTTLHWNSSGCSVVSSSSSEITCTCNHLTNFAVLLSAESDDTTIQLEWITDIGCAISIVCLLFSIVVFTAYRQLRGIRNTIHRNLCINLLLAEVLLLFAMDRGDKSPALCTFFACVLHFLFLSAFSWMALEGCHIILLLWKVFNPKRDYYERYYLAGYGIPLVIVSITVGVGYDAYQNSISRYCWIPVERNLRLSFIIPVVLVVLLNIAALCLVLWKMSRLKQAADKSTSEKVSLMDYRNWVRGTIILLPLLGVTWLLGLAVWQDTVGVMAYVFTVLNSLQGLGIFVCHVILSKKARELLLRSIYKTGSRFKSTRSTGSTRSGGHKTLWLQLSSSTTNSRASESHSQSRQQPRQRSQQWETGSDSSSSQDCWTPKKFKYDFKVTNPVSYGMPAEKISDTNEVSYRTRGSQ